MADLGLFGICLREGAGGAGLDAVAACIAMEELARCSGAVANAFAIPVEEVLFFDQHGTETHKALIPQILVARLSPPPPSPNPTTAPMSPASERPRCATATAGCSTAPRPG